MAALMEYLVLYKSVSSIDSVYKCIGGPLLVLIAVLD